MDPTAEEQGVAAPRIDQVRGELRREPRTWLVTGAGGFIGSNLVEELLRLGQRVVGLDNFATGRRQNLPEIRALVGEDAWSRMRFIEGDIRDPATCAAACEGVDLVLHQAALGSVPRSIANPVATNQVNIDGFLNMLVAARDAKVERFVFAASSSTYGDHPALPKVEDRIGRPLSPYAVTKLVNELYAHVFEGTYGLQTVGLRYFNVFGRRQDPAGAYAAVIPLWVATLLAGGRCRINGDGESSRDFCYVDNVVQANLLAATTPNPGVTREIYNVAVGGRTTLNDLYAVIRDGLLPYEPRVAGIEPEYGPFRDGDVRHSQADIAKARRVLGYEPQFALRDGMPAALSYYVAQAQAAQAPQTA
ncbi:MAG TPA: SDR family oxidoreductase [Longimicrobiaceae bacterium]|nr:SDR family oxidoreductase [Longimicrobiaceae bacterium]